MPIFNTVSKVLQMAYLLPCNILQICSDLSRFYKLYLYRRTEAREMIFSWNGNYYYEIKVYCTEWQNDAMIIM